MKILSLDQASICGYSVFEDGKLKSYGLGDFRKYNDNWSEVCHQIKLQLCELIEKHNPDYIALEDTVLEKNPKVFKQLSKLLGVLEETAKEYGINCCVVPSPTWRKTCGIKGRKREEKKKGALLFVKRVYGLEGDIDDIAESIGIGYHISHVLKKYGKM